jgi:hypothetical protein
MLDPDSRIAGQGVWQLRKANVTVAFFPSDLVSEVEELNREFTRDRENRRQFENDENAKLQQLVESQKKQIADLSRKPYQEALERKVETLLSELSPNGRRLLCHLVENEPLEVGRPFLPGISGDGQFHQLTFAMNAGVIRHQEVRAGSGMLIRTEYVINPQYRSVLQDKLYRE